MHKQVIKQIIIALVMIALAIFAYSFFESQKPFIEYMYHYIFISDSKPMQNPNLFSDYPENKSGFYKFDPQTIFASLDKGQINLFTIVNDPNDLNTEYDGIAWTQSDFLHAASRLSQQTWNEPLDLNVWSVYDILFSGSCKDNFGGFYSFDITYYKTIKTGYEMTYTARNIKLFLLEGKAVWAGDGDFSTPSIFSWNKIELTKFKIAAEQAVQMADEYGGKIARLNANNKCSVQVNAVKDNWRIDYGLAQFNVLINPFNRDQDSKK